MTVIVLIIILLVIMLLYMWKEAFRNHVSYHLFEYEDFPESFGEVKIFFISDIHKREIDDFIIEQIQNQADIVIIGGDLTEKNVPLYRTHTNIEKLKKVGPVYFVWGNNDYEIDYHMLDALLLEWGVKILDNTQVSFESEKGEKMALIGIDDITLERDRLDLALQDGDYESFRILISHNPLIIKKLTDDMNIRLVLAGHTHGGQINIFGFGLYKKGRVFERGKSKILISNGYGTTMFPLRFGARAETHLITIKHKR